MGTKCGTHRVYDPNMKNWEDYVGKEIVIFSDSQCKNCLKAKKILDDLKIKYNSIEVDKEFSYMEIKRLKQESYYIRFPNIWIGGTHCKGVDGLENMIKDNSIWPLLDKLSISYRKP